MFQAKITHISDKPIRSVQTKYNSLPVHVH